MLVVTASAFKGDHQFNRQSDQLIGLTKHSSHSQMTGGHQTIDGVAEINASHIISYLTCNRGGTHKEKGTVALSTNRKNCAQAVNETNDSTFVLAENEHVKPGLVN